MSDFLQNILLYFAWAKIRVPVGNCISSHFILYDIILISFFELGYIFMALMRWKKTKN